MKEKKTITENHEQDLEEKPQRKKETRMRALSKNALAVLKKVLFPQIYYKDDPNVFKP